MLPPRSCISAVRRLDSENPRVLLTMWEDVVESKEVLSGGRAASKGEVVGGPCCRAGLSTGDDSLVGDRESASLSPTV